MSKPARLEREYRRLLVCYPRTYRRENEEEILAVLLACAQDGQRPGLAVVADLIKGAMRMRLRPAARTPRTVQAAVWLLCVGAAAQLAALVINVATIDSVESAAARRYPPWAAAAVHHVVTVRMVTNRVEEAIGIGVWLLLAWALARRRNLARFAVAAWFGLDCVDMFQAGRSAVVEAPLNVAVGTVIWLLALAASVLLFTWASNRYYRPKPGRALVVADLRH